MHRRLAPCLHPAPLSHTQNPGTLTWGVTGRCARCGDGGQICRRGRLQVRRQEEAALQCREQTVKQPAIARGRSWHRRQLWQWRQPRQQLCSCLLLPPPQGMTKP